MSRRSALIAGVAAAVLVLASLSWAYWQHGANERHVDDLMELSFNYSGFEGDPPHKLHYDRSHIGRSCGEGRERWIGRKASGASDPGVDWLAGAEIGALRFEAEGWDVERWQTTKNSRHVYASRGDDKIHTVYFDGAISISATSGPCNPTIPNTSPIAAISKQVDHFED